MTICLLTNELYESYSIYSAKGVQEYQINNMNSIPEDSKQAAEIFLRKIIRHAYEGTINSIRALLEKGPPGRAKHPKKEELSKWYQQLNEKDREKVLAIIKESVEDTIFSFLVVLDNKTIGLPLENRISDFAVYLQIYANQNDMHNYSPETSIRLNMSYTVNGELHDEFISMIDTSKAERE